MEKNSKIYVAGHKGMVGSTIVRKLQQEGYNQLILKTKDELDLRDQQSVIRFFDETRPEYVFLAAARVGGIYANNTFRAEFLYDNLMIQSNVIHQSYVFGVKKLLFLGSSCIYPKNAPQPLKESYLLTGSLEYTNEPYAIAKITGIKLCENYRNQYGCNFFSCMPTNLYGINDNYNLLNSHVIPALIRKFHEAKINNLDQVEVWGDGSVYREFLFADDLADACLFLMQQDIKENLINIGSNFEIKIKDLAILIKHVIGYEGKIVYNNLYPNGVKRKKLDCSKMKNLGWKPKTDFIQGLQLTYKDFLKKI